MAGFCADEYGCYGSMVMDTSSFPLNCPGWDVYGYQPLWSDHEIRTDEVSLPTVAGRRSYPSRLDQAEHELTVYVNGSGDRYGAAYADPWKGLYDNLQWLWTYAFAPVDTGRGTRAATLALPWSTTGSPAKLKADVKFTPLKAVDEILDPRFAVYRTTMTIPAGRFVAA